MVHTSWVNFGFCFAKWRRERFHVTHRFFDRALSQEIKKSSKGWFKISKVWSVVRVGTIMEMKKSVSRIACKHHIHIHMHGSCSSIYHTSSIDSFQIKLSMTCWAIKSESRHKSSLSHHRCSAISWSFPTKSANSTISKTRTAANPMLVCTSTINFETIATDKPKNSRSRLSWLQHFKMRSDNQSWDESALQHASRGEEVCDRYYSQSTWIDCI